MYQLNGFRKLTPPQNRQLIVYLVKDMVHIPDLPEIEIPGQEAVLLPSFLLLSSLELSDTKVYEP